MRAARSLPSLAAATAVVVIAVAVAVPSAAHAAPPGQTAPLPSVEFAAPADSTDSAAATETAAPEPTHVGYRLRLVLVDLTSALVIGAGAATDSDVLIGAGVAGVYLGAPIAHSLLGDARSGALSFSVRAGLPILGIAAGAGVGVAMEGSHGDPGNYMLAGMIAGIGTAFAIDYGYLARRRVATADRRPRSLTVAPVHGGVSLGLAGAF